MFFQLQENRSRKHQRDHGQRFDRLGYLRGDIGEILAARSQERFRVLLWQDGKFLMQGRMPHYFSLSCLDHATLRLDTPTYLGQHEGCNYLACRAEKTSRQGAEHFDSSNFVPLRQAARGVGEFEVELLFYVQGLFNWHQNHLFCSRCGHANEAIQAGHARQCTNRLCTSVHYPQIDPAVIFSIINNSADQARILLGRKAGWEPARHSVIAGFLEPGERLEDAVRREAYEETGLKVAQIQYIDSQPWPFPNALMLGFSCETPDEQIRLVDKELQSARWYSADEMEADIKEGRLTMPFEVSIAWALINRWFVRQKGYSVDEID